MSSGMGHLWSLCLMTSSSSSTRSVLLCVHNVSGAALQRMAQKPCEGLWSGGWITRLACWIAVVCAKAGKSAPGPTIVGSSCP